MKIATSTLLDAARRSGYAVGAFNVYNLEGILAVIAAAEAEASPAILQFHPASLRTGGAALVAACIAAAEKAAVPVSVHLDHSLSPDEIRRALEAGVDSVMADGSALPYSVNVQFTREMAVAAHAAGAGLEAELGRITGSEDGDSVSERESKMTDPEQAAEFVRESGVDALAVCVGNVHGRTSTEPRFDFGRLSALRSAVSVPLVLHGASGLAEETVRRCIELGVAKFNVNTELREAYLTSLSGSFDGWEVPELVQLMGAAVSAMCKVAREKFRVFRSTGTAAGFVQQQMGVNG